MIRHPVHSAIVSGLSIRLRCSAKMRRVFLFEPVGRVRASRSDSSSFASNDSSAAGRSAATSESCRTTNSSTACSLEATRKCFIGPWMITLGNTSWYWNSRPRSTSRTRSRQSQLAPNQRFCDSNSFAGANQPRGGRTRRNPCSASTGSRSSWNASENLRSCCAAYVSSGHERCPRKATRLG